MARILVVDPDDARRRAVVTRLALEGHVVSWCATDGAAARVMAEHAFDTVVGEARRMTTPAPPPARRAIGPRTPSGRTRG